MMSAVNKSIRGQKVKGQGYESQKQCRGVGLCTLVSAGFF